MHKGIGVFRWPHDKQLVAADPGVAVGDKLDLDRFQRHRPFPAIQDDEVVAEPVHFDKGSPVFHGAGYGSWLAHCPARRKASANLTLRPATITYWLLGRPPMRPAPDPLAPASPRVFAHWHLLRLAWPNRLVIEKLHV